jgi:hypothetical protein
MAHSADESTKEVVQSALKEIGELKDLIKKDQTKHVLEKLDKIAAGLSQVQL